MIVPVGRGGRSGGWVHRHVHLVGLAAPGPVAALAARHPEAGVPAWPGRAAAHPFTARHHPRRCRRRRRSRAAAHSGPVTSPPATLATDAPGLDHKHHLFTRSSHCLTNLHHFVVAEQVKSENGHFFPAWPLALALAQERVHGRADGRPRLQVGRVGGVRWRLGGVASRSPGRMATCSVAEPTQAYGHLLCGGAHPGLWPLATPTMLAGRWRVVAPRPV
jgi:hypothetical protein